MGYANALKPEIGGIMKRKSRKPTRKQRKKRSKKSKKPHMASKLASPRSGGLISDEMAAILLFLREPSDVIVRKNPILLEDSCIRELKSLEDSARAAGKAGVAKYYTDRLELLELCREIGVDDAFRQAGSLPNEITKICREASILSSGLAEGPIADRDLSKLDAAASLWKSALSNPVFRGLPRDLQFETMCEAGGVFLIRFQKRGELSDLDMSIDVLGKAVADIPDDSPTRPRLLSNLAAARRARYDASGSTDDLYKAARACDELLPLITPDMPDYRGMLSNIGMLTSRLYEVTGRLQDLERPISHLRAAIDRKGDLPRDSKALGNLGILLCRRYERTGSLNDLDEAISHLEEAVQLTSETGEAIFVGSLASALCDRFERSGDLSDINRAISLHEKELKATPPTSVDRPAKLNDLAVALKSRSRRTRSEEDLHEAIRSLEDAQELLPPTNPNRFKIMLNLHGAFVNLYILNSDLEQLEMAIRIAGEALPLLGPDSPWRAAALLAYSEALLLRYENSKDQEHIASARAVFQDACRIGADHAPYNFLTVARRWAIWELKNHRWEKAIEAGERGAASISSLLGKNVLRRHKESWLRDAQGLAAALAYAYARLGELKKAVEILEGGQARLLSEALGRERRRLNALRERGHFEIYEQYSEITRQISGLRNAEVGGSRPTATLESLGARLDDVIDTIREIEGYEDFLASSTFDRLCSAASEAPIVYLFITAAGSAALIITADGCVPVWLDNLSVESVRRELLGDEKAQEAGYFRRYSSWRESTSDVAAFIEWKDRIDKTTKWLYGSLMAPILDQLKSYPEIVLIPCGLFSLLPLHAAWTEDPLALDGRRYAIDQLCIRFAPNGQTIVSALQTQSVESESRLLAVGEPQADKLSSLPWADFEVACVCSTFPLASQTRLEGAAASEDAVLRALDSATCFHFAGHSSSSPMAPLQGGLFLSYDTRLRVGKLVEQEFPKLRTAILSACETALPGIQLPDEVVGLPAALLSAGATRVIASLWSVADASTSLLMARFYQFWRQDGQGTAEALRSAQRWLRTATRQELIRWSDEQQKRHGVSAPPSFPRGERPFSAPFYWAAFTFNGR
jgi:CHAT domain-containing protein/tetratricopeptide (TPR) repeat protein